MRGSSKAEANCVHVLHQEQPYTRRRLEEHSRCNSTYQFVTSQVGVSTQPSKTETHKQKHNKQISCTRAVLSPRKMHFFLIPSLPEVWGNPYFSFIPRIDSGKHTGGLANVCFFLKVTPVYPLLTRQTIMIVCRCPLSPCDCLI